MNEIIAISLREPWLHLIISGKKHWEFRRWRLGEEILPMEILLCSSRKYNQIQKNIARSLAIPPDAEDAYRLVLGHARAVAIVTTILPAKQAWEKAQESDLACKRVVEGYFDSAVSGWGWRIDCVRPIEPFPVKGTLSYWYEPISNLRYISE